jgi:hypothetical protein
MASIRISSTREEYPGKNDSEIAAALAEKSGYLAVVRYKSSAVGDNFTDFGLCRTEAEIRGYMTSPYCHDVEVLYDSRATLFPLNSEHVLNGSCKNCGRHATSASLQLGAGNDFYFCPKCGLLYCEDCYPKLPLTASPGYATCAVCRIQIKRTLPDFFLSSPHAVPAPQQEKLEHNDVGKEPSTGTAAKVGFLHRLFGGAAKSGSKAELIATIHEEMKKNKGGYIETLEKTAETIAKSKRFKLETVKELVLDAFFLRLGEGDVGTVPMRLGAKMGGAPFAQWLAENVVVGRVPAQMMDHPRQYGAFGKWQDAKSICEKYGIKFNR